MSVVVDWPDEPEPADDLTADDDDRSNIPLTLLAIVVAGVVLCMLGALAVAGVVRHVW